MARSVHTTRRQLLELKKTDFADAEIHRDLVKDVRVQLRQKRRITAQVNQERRDQHLALSPSDPMLIPIVMVDHGPYIHYPANETDLRNLMLRLPRGVLDGLNRIELRLEANPRNPGETPDPFVSRLGSEVLPGVYSAKAIGTYYRLGGRIALSAYVYQADLPHRDVIELFLKLKMLSTFAHEVAHRFDCTQRRARGRWLAENRERNEIYAEGFQQSWTHEHVLPYIEAAYPHRVEALLAWIESHGGARISLAELFGDARRTGNGWLTRLKTVFSARDAFVDLLQSVTDAQPADEIRVGFAQELHYAGLHEAALQALETVLHQDNHLEALTLKADIRVHQNRFAEARVIAEQILTAHPGDLDALIVRCDALEGLKDWAELVGACTRLISRDEVLEYQLRAALFQRARANLKLKAFAQVKADVLLLEGIANSHWPWMRKRIEWLKAETVRRTRPALRKAGLTKRGSANK